MCQGLNSHYFHIIGDGHQPNSRGLYTHYKDPIRGGMTIPNIATFDHGTNDLLASLGMFSSASLIKNQPWSQIDDKNSSMK